MTNSTLQHDQPVTPHDEEAIKDYLDKNDTVEKNQDARLEKLAHMYPQRTDRDQPYGRYTDIDSKSSVKSPRFDVSQSIEWYKVVLLGLILPLPFFAFDWLLIALVNMLPISGSVVVAMVGIPYVLGIVLTAYIMKHYFDEKIEMIGLNARTLLWSTLLFAFPLIQLVRFLLVSDFLNGIMPPIFNIGVYYVATVSTLIASLLGFTFVLYRYNNSQEKRIRAISGIVILPYLIGIVLAVFAFIR